LICRLSRREVVLNRGPQNTFVKKLAVVLSLIMPPTKYVSPSKSKLPH